MLWENGRITRDMMASMDKPITREPPAYSSRDEAIAFWQRMILEVQASAFTSRSLLPASQGSWVWTLRKGLVHDGRRLASIGRRNGVSGLIRPCQGNKLHMLLFCLHVLHPERAG